MDYQLYPLFPADSTPLIRLLLSAQGTLQLILRAYFNTAIQIKVLSHIVNQVDQYVFVERVIQLVSAANGQVFCLAKSVTEFPTQSYNASFSIASEFNLGKIFHTFQLAGSPVPIPFRTELLYYAYNLTDCWTASNPELNYETSAQLDASVLDQFGPIGARRIYQMHNEVIRSTVYEMFPKDLFQ